MLLFDLCLLCTPPVKNFDEVVNEFKSICVNDEVPAQEFQYMSFDGVGYRICELGLHILDPQRTSLKELKSCLKLIKNPNISYDNFKDLGYKIDQYRNERRLSLGDVLLERERLSQLPDQYKEHYCFSHYPSQQNQQNNNSQNTSHTLELLRKALKTKEIERSNKSFTQAGSDYNLEYGGILQI